MSILLRETFSLMSILLRVTFDVYPIERDIFFDVYPMERDIFFDVYPSVILLTGSISISNCVQLEHSVCSPPKKIGQGMNDSGGKLMEMRGNELSGT